MKKFILILATLVAFAAVAQDERRNPLEDYKYAAQKEPWKCSNAFQLVRLTEQWDMVAGCTEKAIAAVKMAYAPAAQTLTKKPKAQAALKEHLVKVIEQIKGVNPESGERMTDYERRQSALKSAASEALTRLELEL